MSLITVITPTYNRKAELVNLFNSLQSQTSKNFEWLIVDDGSTDDTKSMVETFRKQADFPVRYIYQPNGGKHTALNAGIKEIFSELTFIVDSDDTVLSEGIATITQYHSRYSQTEGLCGYSFLRCNTKDEALLEMPDKESCGSYVNKRVKQDRPGDMAEVFYTKVLKEYPFPVFAQEKFLSEDVVWIPMGLRYAMIFINEAIYRCEYLPDGLTRNDKRHKFASPLGSMLRGKMLMHKQCGIKANIKGAIIYDCYRREISKEIPAKVQVVTLREKILTGLLYPAGIYFNKRWKPKN